jgi:hypothetical protein
LIRVCRELQHLRGAEPFYISYGTAATVLGLNPRTAAAAAGRRLEMLCADGVLVLVQRGVRPNASTYFYKGHK